MSVENANYISQLNKLAPTGSEFVSEGDDHIRVVKKAVQQSLPNITGVVTATQQQLDTVTSAEAYFPEGGIIMWSGVIVDIPAGWALCNGVGNTDNGGAIPDLRGRFVLGAQDQTATPHGDDTRLGWEESNKGDLLKGATGGNWLIATSGGTTGGTAITTAQMPSHTHTLFSKDSGSSYMSSHSGGSESLSSSTKATSSTGGGQTHTHSIPQLWAAPMNPYLVLAYIIRTGNSFVTGV